MAKKKRIHIIRIHMEEDAGKLKHGETPETASFSYVDFNRTGVPLVEIVSGPDIRSPQEAGDYLRKLRAILQYLEICTGNMERGKFSMRRQCFRPAKRTEGIRDENRIEEHELLPSCGEGLGV